MIDIVEAVIPGVSARGFKNFTWNEWFFPVHFVGNPNVPGAIQLESLAQMLTVAITTLPGLLGKITHALSHEVKFYKEVKPGDKFEISTNVISWKRGIALGSGRGIVNGELVCEANMKIAIPEILEKFIPKIG
jgi:3-hydroxyacyl-[acyl-carrier-protein] dehydratase